MKKNSFKFLILIFVVFIGSRTFSQILYKNEGVSKSVGRVSSGELINGYKLPYKGENFKYFSPFSYYILNRSFVHSKVYHTIIDSYKLCEEDCPDIQFRIMECSTKKGGRAFPHITHQIGLSVDFMTPLIKENKPKKTYDHTGIWRYLMNFDKDGKANINSSVEIDFNTIAKHIINLNKAAKKNGLKIKKIILEINLKDDLFKSEEGKKLKNYNIYFVKKLSPKIDKLHDDHYHVDFEVL